MKKLKKDGFPTPNKNICIKLQSSNIFHIFALIKPINMILKTSLKILTFLLALYVGWYVFNFLTAWGGIGVIITTLIGAGVYLENDIKNYINKKN